MPRRPYNVTHHDHPRLIALAADVGHALTTCRTLTGTLQGCADALVEHLDASLVRLWTRSGAQEAPRLRASAGVLVNQEEGQPPFDQSLVQQIIQQRTPVLSHNVSEDLPAGAQEWAAQNGSRTFAGYPLVVEDQCVGVLALFAPQFLSPIALQAVESAADQMALGIERSRAAQALQASEERYRAAFTHAAVGVTIADLQDCCLEANAAFCALTGYSEEELLHKDFPSLTHPDDLADSLAWMARLRAGEMPSVVMEKRYIRKDGSIVWVQNSVALICDEDGQATSTIALTEDINRRKQAEAQREQAEAQREEAGACQRTFARDVLASVTEGRLTLCERAEELPPPLSPAGPAVALSPTEGLRELRHRVMDAARAAGYGEERVGDLVIAASEAGMNAIVHAETGTAFVSVAPSGTVQVRVEDQGGGITLENLPKATLARGFSTKATMGQGLKMMLETVDRLFLLTGPGGTTVVLEQERDKPLPTPL